MSNFLCIYHGTCADGFTAAWVVRSAASLLGEQVEYIPGVYQTPPPDVRGRTVILADFSYKRPVIESMLETCKQMIILDHHKSAIEDLATLAHPKLTTVFDVSRSGAGIAWDNYFPGRVPPQLLLHIEDRDLFKFEIEGSQEVCAAVFSYEYDFKVWDRLMTMPLDVLFSEGIAINRNNLKIAHELIAATSRAMVIGGVSVPTANIPYYLATDAGNIMCQGVPFAACYFDTPEGRKFSLRSTPGVGADVSEVAKKYGGGGHKHASGFRVPIGWEGDGDKAFPFSRCI